MRGRSEWSVPTSLEGRHVRLLWSDSDHWEGIRGKIEGVRRRGCSGRESTQLGTIHRAGGGCASKPSTPFLSQRQTYQSPFQDDLPWRYDVHNGQLDVRMLPTELVKVLIVPSSIAEAAIHQNIASCP